MLKCLSMRVKMRWRYRGSGVNDSLFAIDLLWLLLFCGTCGVVMVDYKAVLVQFDTARKGSRSRRRRKRPTGIHISLLVIRVLF